MAVTRKKTPELLCGLTGAAWEHVCLLAAPDGMLDEAAEERIVAIARAAGADASVDRENIVYDLIDLYKVGSVSKEWPNSQHGDFVYVNVGRLPAGTALLRCATTWGGEEVKRLLAAPTLAVVESVASDLMSDRDDIEYADSYDEDSDPDEWVDDPNAVVEGGWRELRAAWTQLEKQQASRACRTRKVKKG